MGISDNNNGKVYSLARASLQRHHMRETEQRTDPDAEFFNPIEPQDMDTSQMSAAQLREHVAYLDEQDRASFEDEALEEQVRAQNEYHADEVAYYEEREKRGDELNAKEGNFHEFVLQKQDGVIDEDTVYLTVGRDFVEASGYDLLHFDTVAQEEGLYALDELKDSFREDIFEGKKGYYFIVAEKDRAQFMPVIDPKEQALEAKRAEAEALKLDKKQVAFINANYDEINDIYLSTLNFIKAADVFASEQTAHYLGSNQGVMTNDKDIRRLNYVAKMMMTASFGYKNTASFIIFDLGSAEKERAFFREQFSEMRGFFSQIESTQKMEAMSSYRQTPVFSRPEGFVPTEKPKPEPMKPEPRRGLFKRALKAFSKS